MRIAIGLSGGVDSAVAAALLVQAGHEVVGVHLECWRAPGCRAEDDRKDALTVALHLGIPFQALDFRDAYRETVVERFFADYERGLTPNPDVWCNTEIKFGLFYEWALGQGFDVVATGHYAKIADGELQRPADEHKDQTYFLYRLRPDQLEHVVFPLSDLTKPEVREKAKELSLPVASKPDSQGICFIGEIDVRDFLRERLGEKPGDVLDVDGNVIGRHKGHWFYTVGQRHGFELFGSIYTKHKEWKHVLPPLYVIRKDGKSNTIVVGFGHDTLASRILVEDVMLRSELPSDGSLRVRVRHGGELLECSVSPDAEDLEVLRIKFVEPQRGVAAGQAAVFYGGPDHKTCFGGGIMMDVRAEG